MKLTAAGYESSAVSFNRVQLPDKRRIVPLSKPNSHEAAIVRRGRRGEILTDRPARGIQVVVEILPQKVSAGIELGQPRHLRNTVEKLQNSDAGENVAAAGRFMH